MTKGSYPLAWPKGWARTKYRIPALFFKNTLTVDDAVGRLNTGLERLNATQLVLSSNVERDLNGSIRGGRTPPVDPGVAVYFTWRKQRRVFACDKWNCVADNIAAIALHIEAMRGQERWGVGSLERAFTGYTALPPPFEWWIVLGQRERVDLDIAEAIYRALAKRFHPDQVEGDVERMAELNRAIEAARLENNNKSDNLRDGP